MKSITPSRTEHSREHRAHRTTAPTDSIDGEWHSMQRRYSKDVYLRVSAPLRQQCSCDEQDLVFKAPTPPDRWICVCGFGNGPIENVIGVQDLILYSATVPAPIVSHMKMERMASDPPGPKPTCLVAKKVVQLPILDVVPFLTNNQCTIAIRDFQPMHIISAEPFKKRSREPQCILLCRRVESLRGIDRGPRYVQGRGLRSQNRSCHP